MMVWYVTKDKITERMAVPADDAWSVPGTAQQPPPDKSRPNPISDHIDSGRWEEGFRAQDEMLDKHMEKYNLQGKDWRPEMYKQMEGKND